MIQKSHKRQIVKEDKDEKSCILAIGYCGGGVQGDLRNY